MSLYSTAPTVVHSGHLFPKPSHNTTVLKYCVVKNCHNTTEVEFLFVNLFVILGFYVYGCLQSTKDVFVDFKTLLFVPCLYSCKVYYSRKVCSLYTVTSHFATTSIRLTQLGRGVCKYYIGQIGSVYCSRR